MWNESFALAMMGLMIVIGIALFWIKWSAFKQGQRQRYRELEKEVEQWKKLSRDKIPSGKRRDPQQNSSTE